MDDVIRWIPNRYRTYVACIPSTQL